MKIIFRYKQNVFVLYTIISKFINDDCSFSEEKFHIITRSGYSNYINYMSTINLPLPYLDTAQYLIIKDKEYQ